MYIYKSFEKGPISNYAFLNEYSDGANYVGKPFLQLYMSLINSLMQHLNSIINI